MTSVDQLILEVTRKCNMSCPHCLRGAQQNCDMSYETAIAAINQFSSINSITFSGGEPTLCGETIEKIVNYIIDNGVDIYGFYMATNGKVVNMQTMFALTRLYGYIYKRYGMDEAQCCVDISLDQYHDRISDENEGILHAFSFVGERGKIRDFGLINEGRAYENRIGHRNMDRYKEFTSEEWGSDESRYDMVYVNAKGNIYPDCDFSFHTQDDTLPNINIQDGDITKLVEEYNSQLIYR